MVLVADSCYGVVNEKVAHFRNPSYPNVDMLPNYCTYSIKVSLVEYYLPNEPKTMKLNSLVDL